jgi:hypothetical protein
MPNTLYTLGRFVLLGALTSLGLWIKRVSQQRSGGLTRNAFLPPQPGWPQLRRRYDSKQSRPNMETLPIGRIGNVRLTGVLDVGFEVNAVVIRNRLGFSSTTVRIPYADLKLLQAPEQFQATRFSEPEFSPGLFMAGGVEIELQAYWADQLLKHMAAAPVA